MIDQVRTKILQVLRPSPLTWLFLILLLLAQFFFCTRTLLNEPGQSTPQYGIGHPIEISYSDGVRQDIRIHWIVLIANLTSSYLLAALSVALVKRATGLQSALPLYGGAALAVISLAFFVSIAFSKIYWGYAFHRPPVLQELKEVTEVSSIIPVATEQTAMGKYRFVIDPRASIDETLAYARQHPTDNDDSSAPESMKGYELYSWQVQGEWYFALVVGMNRIKTYDEISAPEVRVKGLDAIKGELDQLPSGEQVFWSAARVPNTVLPPGETVDEVVAYCRQRGMRLEIEQTDSTPQPAVTPRPTPAPTTTFTPTPYCRPSEASVSLSTSTRTLEVGQSLSVTVTLANGDTSGVRLGQIQYSLGVQPSSIFTSDNLEPVVHPLSLDPGESEKTEFVLRAVMPGRATLTGSTSFEMHALDYSSGSWSGCNSGPLEIVVTPDTDKSSVLLAVSPSSLTKQQHLGWAPSPPGRTAPR